MTRGERVALFADLPVQAAPEKLGRPLPRLRESNRQQVELRAVSLEELLPADHRARVVWAFVEGLDLSPLYRKIKAVEGRPGHPPCDPRIMMALWLSAALEEVGSARELDRLCQEHHGFQWICGGVSVNYHTLADFRGAHGDILDRLLTESFAALMHEGLADVQRLAQDGVRVRAAAGAASFRRQRTLVACEKAAMAEVARLRQEVALDPGAGTRRKRAACQRAAREREARVGQALKVVEELAAKRTAGNPPPADPPPPAASEPARRSKPPAEPRASTTDAEARVMKMSDGGFRPAFNAQFATDTQSQLIAGVAIGNVGSDHGQLAPMVEQLTERYDPPPAEMLVDGGFAGLADIEAVSEGGTVVYAPVLPPKDADRDPHAPLSGDTAAIAAWRIRMGADTAKQIHKERAATAECVNALARNRGLRQFVVRGLAKARAVVLWFALAHNLMRAHSLRAAATIAA